MTSVDRAILSSSVGKTDIALICIAAVQINPPSFPSKLERLGHYFVSTHTPGAFSSGSSESRYHNPLLGRPGMTDPDDILLMDAPSIAILAAHTCGIREPEVINRY